ncbi:MAG: universal stress protein [ANME-2 cluster archaeon]|nr:MAG: universal stress protein [ANME-2 cluster archaeon]
MPNNKEKGQTTPQKYKVLVAVDFSPSSARALRRAKTIMGRTPDQILVLHVINTKFIESCIKNEIGTEEQIKKTLFLQAKKNMKKFIRAEEMERFSVKTLICEGTPFLEINKKAAETEVDMIVMGNRGNSGDMETIFFGSTTERVLRFMSRPVLCVPVEEDSKK